MGGITTQEREQREKVVNDAGLEINDAPLWYRRYYSHKGNAATRNLKSELTFEDYLQKAKVAGITSPSQLGSFSGQFHLGRIGDVGDYGTENCRFITSNENHRESFENGGQSARIERQRGATKETSDRARKISEAHTGRTKETHAYLAERGKKVAEAKSKTFVITAPDGTIYEGKNLREFCRNHDLVVGLMSYVCLGKNTNHKGWTGHYVDPDVLEPDLVGVFE